MPALGQRVTQLEGQMQEQTGAIGDVRRAIEDLRIETRAEIRDLRGEMDRRFERVDQRFDRMDTKIDRQFTWLVGILVGVLLALAGLAFQVARLQSA